MNKKAIAILGAIFLLIVGTLGFLIYSKYSGNKTPTPTATSNNPGSTSDTPETVDTSSSTPEVVPQTGIIKLTDDQVISPALFFNGGGVTYFDRSGGLYQASLQENGGQVAFTDKKKLDIPVKRNIVKILWPSRGNDFIAQFVDPSGNPAWSYFNSSTQTYFDYPAQVTAVDWMPTGNKIMYFWTENGKTTLNLSDPDTRNWQTLADMWENDDVLSVSPDGSQLLFYEVANSKAINPINLVSVDGKLWKGVVKTGFNFGVLWSPDGQKFLFAKKDFNTQKYQLWVYNLASEENKNLGLFTTVDKAVWSKDSNVIFAAVPNSGNTENGGLTVDNFYRMDTSTLDKKQYSQSAESSIDGRDLFLNSLDSKLFFRNAQDGGLYYLDLTQ